MFKKNSKIEKILFFSSLLAQVIYHLNFELIQSKFVTYNFTSTFEKSMSA